MDGYRYDKADVQRAAGLSQGADINQALTDLGVHPSLDLAAGAVGDSTAALVIERSAGILTTLVSSVASAGDEGVDVTPGLEHIGQQVRQACAAAFIRGVLIGHELAAKEADRG